MSVPFILFAVSAVALFLVVVSEFFDAVFAMIDLLFLRGALLLGGYLGLLFVLESVEDEIEWLGDGDGGALATTALFCSLAGIIVRYRILDARDTARSMRERERKAALRAERGVTAEGRVTEIERTGLSINDNPEVRFTIAADLGYGNELTITHERIVDIIDLPRFQPGRSVRVIYDPEDHDNLEVLWEPGAAGASAGAETSAAALSGTGAPFSWPLWLFGMENAERWLLPPRDEAQPPVVIVDITDPHDATADDAREMLVDMAAFLLAEHLWLRTDAAASAAVLIHTETGRLLQPVGELADWEGLRPFVDALERAPVLAWGAALADLEREGIQLKLRLPGDDTERALAGPLPELTEMLIDWLVRRGLCQRLDPPAWWVAPTPRLRTTYATALHDLQLQILADHENEAIGPLDADLHAGFVERALEAAREHGDACPQLRLIAAVTAVYAARADRLPAPLRSRAVELVLAERDESTAVFRLSPHLLRQLGDTLAAHSRSTAFGREDDDAYAAWLREIDAL